jgi:predicted RNase H-like nuclease (RuvC/YqgF family)
MANEKVTLYNKNGLARKVDASKVDFFVKQGYTKLNSVKLPEELEARLLKNESSKVEDFEKKIAQLNAELADAKAEIELLKEELEKKPTQSTPTRSTKKAKNDVEV